MRRNPLQRRLVLVRKQQVLPPAENLLTPGEFLPRLKDGPGEFTQINGVVSVLTQQVNQGKCALMLRGCSMCRRQGIDRGQYRDEKTDAKTDAKGA